jgi:glycosyltransferase involved in cell wall biosynthesis
MEGFWRSKKAFHILRQAVDEAVALESQDAVIAVKEVVKAVSRNTPCFDVLKRAKDRFVLRRDAKEEVRQKKFPVVDVNRPVVFASACVDEKSGGGWKYCGGVKELNYFVKLLRIHGYEAYLVTYDGSYEPWLMDHQPHISLGEFERVRAEAEDVRCVTSLASARTFIERCEKIWFWDMELAVSEHNHYHLFAGMYNRGKIARTAAISRTIQAWHMAHFGVTPVVIPNMIDERVWSPVVSARVPHRIGYMQEGRHSHAYVDVIRNALEKAATNHEFLCLQGDEAAILAQMRTCDIYLSLNEGKDALWGEGCPRTVLEALSVGAVVVGFDLIGSREVLIDHLNGRIVKRHDVNEMAAVVLELLENPECLEELRTAGAIVNAKCHTLARRWDNVCEFLSLPA